MPKQKIKTKIHPQRYNPVILDQIDAIAKALRRTRTSLLDEGAEDVIAKYKHLLIEKEPER